MRMLLALVLALLARQALAACTATAVPVIFGAYNPVSGQVLDSAGRVDVSCVPSAGYTISMSAGLGSYAARQMASGPEHDGTSSRELLERLALAGIGAVALTADRAEELARDLTGRGELRRDEARQTIEEAMTRWRGDATRLTERAGASLQSVFDQLGLISREVHDELELRVAQLEHRLRLAESRLESRSGPTKI